MKKIAVIMLFILSVFIIAGCSAQSGGNTNISDGAPSGADDGDTSVIISSDDNVSAPTESPSAEPVATATPVPRATAGASEDVKYNGNTIEIVYNDPETGETYTETYDAGEDAGADAAIKAVNELILKGKFGDIGFNKVVKTGSNIFVDFNDSVYNLAQYSLLEYPSLEAIADAYLNNVEGVSGVYFTVNGGGYSSMNLEYDADEPFKMK